VTQLSYHGVVFEVSVYMTSGGPGLTPDLTVGEDIQVVEIESLDTWLDFSRLMPEDYTDRAADDPHFVEAAIEAAEYDRDDRL
jgi:hypothetical protein